MVVAGLEEFERRHLFLTGLRASATGFLVLVVYFTVPISDKPHTSVLFSLTSGLALFVAVLIYEVRAILRASPSTSPTPPPASAAAPHNVTGTSPARPRRGCPRRAGAAGPSTSPRRRTTA